MFGGENIVFFLCLSFGTLQQQESRLRTQHTLMYSVSDKGSHIGTKAFLYERSCISVHKDNKLILVLCARFPPAAGWKKPNGREKNSFVFIFWIRKNKSCIILNRSAKWVSVNAIKRQQIREESDTSAEPCTALLPSSGFCFKLVLDLWVWGLVSEQCSSSTLELSRWHLSMTPVG